MNMFLFPNGQNIQIYAPPTRPKDPEGFLELERPTPTSEESLLQALKSVAPHMNRKERRAQLKKLKTQAKSQTSALARAEIKKQKEKSRD